MTARHIGEAIGKVMELDGYIEKRVWCVPFILVRVLLRLSPPIPSGYMLYQRNLEPVHILFKYERLTEFCYACGLLGHMQSSCSREIAV